MQEATKQSMPFSVRVVLFSEFVDALGLGILVPLLPFLAESFNASPSEITLLVALFALVRFFFEPLMGKLGDNYSKKHILVVAGILSCTVYAGMVLATSLIALFVWRALGGVAAARQAILNAVIVEELPKEEQPRFLGLLSSMNGFGMLAGPFIAAIPALVFDLTQEQMFTTVLAIAFVFALTSLICITRLKVRPSIGGEVESSATTDGPAKTKIVLRINLSTYVLNFGLFLSAASIYSVSVLFMSHKFGWTISGSGVAVGFMTGVMALSRAVLAHRLIAWIDSSTKTAVYAALASGILLASAGLMENEWAFYVLYCLSAGCNAIAVTAATVVIAQRTDAQFMGLGMGYFGSTASIGVIAGAVMYGFIFENIGVGAPFVVAGSIAAAFAIVLMFWKGSASSQPV